MKTAKKSGEPTAKLIVIVGTLLLIFLFALLLVYLSGSSLEFANESRKNIWDRVEENLGENTFLLGEDLSNKIITKDFVEVLDTKGDALSYCNKTVEKLECKMLPLVNKANFDKPVYLFLFANRSEESFFERTNGEEPYLIDTTNPEDLTIVVNSENKRVNGFGVTEEYLRAIEFCYEPFNICGTAFLKDNEDINDYGYKKFSKNLKETLKSINFSRSDNSDISEYKELY